MDAWADHPPACGVVLLLSLACLLIVSQLVSSTMLPADSVAMDTLPMAAATAGETADAVFLTERPAPRGIKTSP
jgi:hypothetical protein